MTDKIAIHSEVSYGFIDINNFWIVVFRTGEEKVVFPLAFDNVKIIEDYIKVLSFQIFDIENVKLLVQIILTHDKKVFDLYMNRSENFVRDNTDDALEFALNWANFNKRLIDWCKEHHQTMKKAAENFQKLSELDEGQWHSVLGETHNADIK